MRNVVHVLDLGFWWVLCGFFSVQYINGICASDMPDSFTSCLRHSRRMNYSELSFCLLTGLLEEQLASS